MQLTRRSVTAKALATTRIAVQVSRALVVLAADPHGVMLPYVAEQRGMWRQYYYPQRNTEITEEELCALDADDQIEVMRWWVSQHVESDLFSMDADSFENPVESMPYDSEDGTLTNVQ